MNMDDAKLDFTEIKKYVDQESRTIFHYSDLVDDEACDLFDENGLLLANAGKWIVKHPTLTRRFLLDVAGDKAMLSRQQRLIPLLLDVASNVRHNKTWKALETELKACFEFIAHHARDNFSRNNEPLTLDTDELSYYSGFGQGSGAIHYGLSIARNVALLAYYETFARRWLDKEKLEDVMGTCEILVTNPKDSEFAQVYTGHYSGPSGAIITQCQSGDCWKLAFEYFPPMPARMWHTLEYAAYRAAAPFIEETLLADVQIISELSD